MAGHIAAAAERHGEVELVTANTSAPTQVGTDTNWATVAADGAHTMALRG